MSDLVRDAFSGDHIRLSGVRVHANHGVFDFERAAGQLFVIDVTVWLDLSAAAGSDRLAATVHYGELAEAVVAVVSNPPVDLIETVAQRVVDVAFGFAGALATEVTVHKPQAPITVPFDDVTVTLRRVRPDAGFAVPGAAELSTAKPSAVETDTASPDAGSL